jgi:filamentous hemagglutinin
LSHQQKADKTKALAECKTLACRGGVNLKYLGIDAMQDAGLVIGVGGGIGYQSVEQAAAVVDLVRNLPETLTALSAIVSDPEFRAKVGNQIADDYKQRIDLQTRAYNDGGWDGSITAGVEAGRLAVDIVAVGTAAVGAGKIVAAAVRAGPDVIASEIAVGANATTNFLENMALRNVQVGGNSAGLGESKWQFFSH